MRLEGINRTLAMVMSVVVLTIVSIFALGALSDPGTDSAPPPHKAQRIAFAPIAGGLVSAGDACYRDPESAWVRVILPNELTQTFPAQPRAKSIPPVIQVIEGWQVRHIDLRRGVLAWKASGARARPLTLDSYRIERPRLEFYQAPDEDGEGATAARIAGGPAGALAPLLGTPAPTAYVIEAKSGRTRMGPGGAATFELFDGVVVRGEGIELRTERLRCEIAGDLAIPSEEQKQAAAREGKAPRKRDAPAEKRSGEANRRVTIDTTTPVTLHRAAPLLHLTAGGLNADLALERLALAPPVRIELEAATASSIRAGAGLATSASERSAKPPQKNAKKGAAGERDDHVVVTAAGQIELIVARAPAAPKDEPATADLGGDSTWKKAGLTSGEVAIRGGVRITETGGAYDLTAQTVILRFAPEGRVLEAMRGQTAPAAGVALGGALAAAPITRHRSPATATGRDADRMARPFFHHATAEGDVVLKVTEPAKKPAENGDDVPPPAPRRWEAHGDRLDLVAWPPPPDRADGTPMPNQPSGRAVLSAAEGTVKARDIDGGSWLHARRIVLLHLSTEDADAPRRIALAQGAVRARIDRPTLERREAGKAGEAAPASGDGNEDDQPLGDLPDAVLVEGDLLEAVLAAREKTEGTAEPEPEEKERRLLGRGLESLRLVSLGRGDDARPARLASEDEKMLARAGRIEWEPRRGLARMRGAGEGRPLLQRGTDRFVADAADFDDRAGTIELTGAVEGRVSRDALEGDGAGGELAGRTDSYDFAAARLRAILDEERKQVARLEASGAAAAPELRGPDVVRIDAVAQAAPTPDEEPPEPLRVRAPEVSWDLAGGIARLARGAATAEDDPRPRIEQGRDWIVADTLEHHAERPDGTPARAVAWGEVRAEVSASAAEKAGRADDAGSDEQPAEPARRLPGRWRLRAAHIEAILAAEREDAAAAPANGAGGAPANGGGGARGAGALADAKNRPAVARLVASGRLAAPDGPRGPDQVEIDQLPDETTEDPVSVRAVVAAWDVDAGRADLQGPKDGPRPRLLRGRSWIEADRLAYRQTGDEAPDEATATGGVVAELDLPEKEKKDGAAKDAAEPADPTERAGFRRIRVEAARAVARIPESTGAAAFDPAAVAGGGGAGEKDDGDDPARRVPPIDVSAHADALWPGASPRPVAVTGLDAAGKETGFKLFADTIEWEHQVQQLRARGAPARAIRALPDRPPVRGRPGAKTEVKEEYLLADEIVYLVPEQKLRLRGGVETLVLASSLRAAREEAEGGGRSDDPGSLLGTGGGEKRVRVYWIAANEANALFDDPAPADRQTDEEEASPMNRLLRFDALGKVQVRELARDADAKPGTPWDVTVSVDANTAVYTREDGHLVLRGEPVRVETGNDLIEPNRFVIDVSRVTGR